MLPMFKVHFWLLYYRHHIILHLVLSSQAIAILLTKTYLHLLCEATMQCDLVVNWALEIPITYLLIQTLLKTIPSSLCTQ